VTGINVYVSVTAIFVVCIFYTVVVSIILIHFLNASTSILFIILQGGMKAVMWTDTLQVIIMYGAMIAVGIT
jgi:hypothetical protein